MHRRQYQESSSTQYGLLKVYLPSPLFSFFFPFWPSAYGIVLPTFSMDLLGLVCWLTHQSSPETLSQAHLEMRFPNSVGIFQSSQTGRISHHKGKQSISLTNAHKARKKDEVRINLKIRTSQILLSSESTPPHHDYL